MRRREFISLLGGAAAWPPAARAQQPGPVRRIGVLMPYEANNPQGQARIASFMQGLRQLGWTDSRDVRIEYRWSAETNEIRKYAAELAALAPDVIFAAGSAGAGPMLEATRMVPIVFCYSPIRSAPGMSRAWRGRVATPAGLRHGNSASARNGWSCSSRSRRA